MHYCESIYSTKRRATREVMIGNVGVGAHHPIRIQSMTTSNTRDVEATVEQVMRLADAGCEIVRMTVQGMKEADACEQIKNRLVQQGYTVPLVADIHFYPPAAMRVVDFVEKVRINPGNFVDKRASFKVIEYDDESYQAELVRIEEKFTPLIEKCKRLKRAMRIGTNHGSLSDRIMNRYGDTPRGMVESALEFARLCRQNDYHDFMFSMKSSNPQVMILAYRLLAAEMYQLGWDYPLHLGVTEAGEGEDGRIKSAMGIGSLLLEGLGDTIRVSLTEDAWHEIDPCQRLVAFARSYERTGIAPFTENYRHIQNIQRRPISFSDQLALHRDGSVLLSIHSQELLQPQLHTAIGCEVKNEKLKLTSATTDSLFVQEIPHQPQAKEKLQELYAAGIGVLTGQSGSIGTHLITLEQAAHTENMRSRTALFSLYKQESSHSSLAVLVKDEPMELWSILERVQPALIVFQPSENRLFRGRQFFEWLQSKKIGSPVILNFRYQCSKEDLIIQAAAECGALLCDGLGEGIWLEGPYEMDFLRTLSFGILQAARMRTSKTEFISCPSCGRTLFNLQDVSRRIRERTAHLPGVKIAIMGCIVNGPGEMADADFGYVGSKPGMIDLYVGKECIERDISFDHADDRLVALIKASGRWVDSDDEEEGL